MLFCLEGYKAHDSDTIKLGQTSLREYFCFYSVKDKHFCIKSYLLTIYKTNNFILYTLMGKTKTLNIKF